MNEQLIKDIQAELQRRGLYTGQIDGRPGIETWTAIAEALLPGSMPAHQPTQGRILRGDGTWPFTARIVGEDIVCENIAITCFGGEFDPQDDGRTASGRNTKREEIDGVSIAMDADQFTNMRLRDPAGYKALKGAPFPRLPWGMQVEVTIGSVKYIPKDGIIDLGPGKGATKNPKEPHALDLTPIAAKHFWPNSSLKSLATNFEERGSFRIIGAAKWLA